MRVDGKILIRTIEECICKILDVDVSVGFIYEELIRTARLAENETEGYLGWGKCFSTFLMDEV